MNTQTSPAGPDRRAPSPRPSSRSRDLMFRVLRWIGGHVAGFYAAVGVFLIAAVALIVIAGLLFAKIADDVMEGSTQAFDDAVLLWLNQHASDKLTGVALDVTALGAGTVVWLVVIIASVFLWSTRHHYSAILLWVAMAGAGLINSTLKAFYARPRPQLFEWRAPYAGETSFPSGHSMGSAVAYLSLAYLVSRLEPTKKLRRFTFFVAIVIIIAVGISRMYLGVHYPSDVMAGWAMGVIWMLFCALGIEAIRYFRHRKPEIAVAEKDLNGVQTKEDAEAGAEARVHEAGRGSAP
jgi:undecaprenyl-diphosphatase